MAYQRKKLVEFATELVRQQPWLTETEVSEKLSVHRHTLQRTLKADGLSFASLKQAAVLEYLEHQFANAQAASLKQFWTELGFVSASGFARYIRHATGKSPTELRGNFILGHSGRKRARVSLDAGKHGGYLCARRWSPSHKVTKKP